MPYTPPSTSPSTIHSTSPIKSSSSYAGLANGNISPTASKQAPLPRSQSAILSSEYIRSTHHHHRRSSGPTSSSRTPIPVAAFAKNRRSPERPSAGQKTNSSSPSSSDDEDSVSLQSRRGQIEELRDSLREQLTQHKAPSLLALRTIGTLTLLRFPVPILSPLLILTIYTMTRQQAMAKTVHRPPLLRMT